MATSSKMNRAKKAATRKPAKKAAPTITGKSLKSKSKAMAPKKAAGKAVAPKKTSGKAGIQAILTAFRGKPKSSAAGAAASTGKAKVVAKPSKGVKAGKPGKKAVAVVPPVKRGAVVAAKAAGKAASRDKAVATEVRMAAKPHQEAVSSKTKKASPGKPGKNSAAMAAAAVVEKVAAQLSGRSQSRPQTDTVCREVACEGLGTTGGYCRLHYIKNWRKIKLKEVILSEGKLNIYIEELVAKYPEKYLEAIRNDLANEKEFAKVISDLDLDESVDEFEGDGSSDGDAVIDSIKREFEDDADGF